MASSFESVGNVLWEHYFPRLVEQWTTPLIWDTADDKKFKAALKIKLESASKEEVQQMLADMSKSERRAEYESLKEEFGD